MTDAAGAEVAALSLIGNWVALARIVECSHTSGAAAGAAVDSGRSAQRTIPGNFHSCCSCRIVVVGAGIAVAVVVVDIGRVDDG